MSHDCTRAIIDLDAVSSNFDAVCRKAKVPVMAVIKADAYGHGAVPIARLLENRCAFFGVSSMSEALELRDAGSPADIDSGLHAAAGFPRRRRLGIRPAIFRREDGEALSRAAVEAEVSAAFHFAVDTGMSRIGFQVTEADADICAEIAALPGLTAEGLFSHFATADSCDLSRARAQAERFDAFDAMLKRRGVRILIRHLNNSAGLMNFDHHYEMVRSGIVTYGLYPSDEVDTGLLPLTPAMRLLSRVSYVKALPPGREISYGGTFVTTRPTVVATVPIGYADGYRRSLSGRFYVLIHGKRAPILGRVCMDQMMVDVTDIPGVQAGDTVTLIGTDGDETISMEEIAAAAGSFNYEFACGISRRVPRVYLRGGQAVHTVHYLTDIFQEEPHGT